VESACSVFERDGAFALGDAEGNGVKVVDIGRKYCPVGCVCTAVSSSVTICKSASSIFVSPPIYDQRDVGRRGETGRRVTMRMNLRRIIFNFTLKKKLNSDWAWRKKNRLCIVYMPSHRLHIGSKIGGNDAPDMDNKDEDLLLLLLLRWP